MACWEAPQTHGVPHGQCPTKWGAGGCVPSAGSGWGAPAEED